MSLHGLTDITLGVRMSPNQGVLRHFWADPQPVVERPSTGSAP